MTTLKFYVKENGKDFPLTEMSEPELFAISESVMTLIPKSEERNCWFEADTCVFVSDDEEEATYGLLRYFTDNPSPKNTSEAESKVPKAIPQSTLDTLQGKTFHVKPIQYGMNPWGTIDICFESLSPKKGIKASELIALALQVK